MSSAQIAGERVRASDRSRSHSAGSGIVLSGRPVRARLGSTSPDVRVVSVGPRYSNSRPLRKRLYHTHDRESTPPRRTPIGTPAPGPSPHVARRTPGIRRPSPAITQPAIRSSSAQTWDPGPTPMRDDRGVRQARSPIWKGALGVCGWSGPSFMLGGCLHTRPQKLWASHRSKCRRKARGTRIPLFLGGQSFLLVSAPLACRS